MNPLQHSHPFSIATYLYRFLFLLLLPLLRGFLSALQGGLWAWVAGAWMDLLFLALLLTLSYLKWYTFQYHFDESGIFYTNGIFITAKTFIPAARISTFAVRQPFWLRPFGIAHVRVDTIARDANKADLSFYTKRVEAERMYALCTSRSPLPRRGDGCFYQPKLKNVIFSSVFTSNSLLGILLLSTFISQAGKILGAEFSESLFLLFEQASREISVTLPALTAGFFAFTLPPIAAGAAIILLVGWLAAFVVNLLQTKGLFSLRYGQHLLIEAGVLMHKKYALRLSDISFIDIRQSLFTRILGLYSVFIDAVGFAKDKSDIKAIIPFSRRGRALQTLSQLLPGHSPSPRTLKPNAGALFKFILVPLWPCLLLPAGTWAACILLPSWAQIIRFAGLMLWLPAVWFLVVRVVDFSTSGLSRRGNKFTLRYSSLYYLHTVIIKADKISMVNIRQSILQRPGGRCDCILLSRSEGRRRHHLRNLDRQAVLSLFDAEDSWTPADAGIPNWYERLAKRLLRLIRRDSGGKNSPPTQPIR